MSSVEELSLPANFLRSSSYSRSITQTFPQFPFLISSKLFQIPDNVADYEDKLPPSIEKESRTGSNAVFPVPPEIRPILSTYRLEVLFWGLRSLKRINLFKIEKPKVVIEVGNSTLISETIFDIDKRPNFHIPVKIIGEIVRNFLNYNLFEIKKEKFRICR